jgi:hypothetical protein
LNELHSCTGQRECSVNIRYKAETNGIRDNGTLVKKTPSEQKSSVKLEELKKRIIYDKKGKIINIRKLSY